LDDDSSTQLEGYTTADDYYWVCSSCFDDFRERFAWKVTTASE
jgi:hypothetical protein